MSDSYEVAERYGVRYSGTLVGREYIDTVDYTRTYSLREVSDAKGKITRFRLLREGGYADVSYIHATLPDGRIVPVQSHLPNMMRVGGARYAGIKGMLITWAREEKVFAKGLGLLDESNWSVLG